MEPTLCGISKTTESAVGDQSLTKAKRYKEFSMENERLTPDSALKRAILIHYGRKGPQQDQKVLRQ